MAEIKKDIHRAKVLSVEPAGINITGQNEEQIKQFKNMMEAQ